MPQISIIVPMHNAQDYIGFCIESLVNQSFKDIEIIIIDDGSTDGSYEICEQYAKRDNRIKIIRKKNTGVSEARNCGIANANGEYVMFVDSDDWLEYDACKQLYEAQEKSDSDLVVADVSQVYQNRRKHVHIFNREFDSDDKKFAEKFQLMCIGYGYNPYPIDQWSVSGIGSVWNKLFKLNIIKENDIQFNPYTFEIYEDNLFTINYLQYVTRICYISKIIYNYRMVNNSSIHRYRANSLEISSRIFEKVQAFIDEQENQELFRKAFNILVIRRLSEELRVYYFNKEAGKRIAKIQELQTAIRQEPYNTAIHSVEMSRLMTAHKLTCLTARSGSAWIMFFGYKMRIYAKKIIGLKNR